jgi:hypothetical protein
MLQINSKRVYCREIAHHYVKRMTSPILNCEHVFMRDRYQVVELTLSLCNFCSRTASSFALCMTVDYTSEYTKQWSVST